MNKIINLIVAMAALTFCFSCNDEWEDEQFAHYVSFKAPINADGCTTVYVKYNADGESVFYSLPLIVSGSTVHSSAIEAVIELDRDSLYELNMANIGERRTDIWYHDLSDADDEANTDGIERVLNSFPTTVTIPAGQTVTMFNLELNLTDLNQEERWILPLKIKEGPGSVANTRKHYNNAMLHIVPFNDYSGTYSATSMLGCAQSYDQFGDLVPGKYDEDRPYVVESKQFFATGDNTAFFFAGAIDHTHRTRANYRVNVTFNDDYTLTLEPSEEALNSDTPLNFSYDKAGAQYSVSEEPDELKTYLLRKLTSVNLKYYITDYTQGEPMNYKFEGSYSMLRIINTQIPDQDQAIQW